MRCLMANLILLSVLFAGSYSADAQQTIESDTTEICIYFKCDHSTFDPEYRNNGLSMDDFVRKIEGFRRDSTCILRSVTVTGSASPDGNTDLNKKLAAKRAANIGNYLQGRLGLDESLLRIESVGIDWRGLYDAVSVSGMPYRDEVLAILSNSPEWIVRGGVVVDGRKRRLQMLQGGRVWRDMSEHIFPYLRYGQVGVVCEIVEKPRTVIAVEPVSEPTEPLSPAFEPASESVVAEESQTDTLAVSSIDPAPETRKPFYMALKTNMLYDMALVPNVGAEFYLGRRWSIGIDWMYGWWNSNKRHNYWRIYGGDLTVRKWLGRRAAGKPLAGHHIGIYGQAFTYDFETGGRGYMGGMPGGTLWDKLNYAAGVEYGYSLPVARRLNIDFTLGVGYWGGEYKEYLPIDGHYVWQATKRRHWFGPTKAEISLVWLIGRGNYNDKKGGKR